jgi:hypothetical protein
MQTEKTTTFRDRQREAKAPLQYAVYKGKTGKFGAMRLNLKKAYLDERRDDGCIFIEMAPPLPANSTALGSYDWENGKIAMALSIADIPKIALYLRNPGNRAFEKTENKCMLIHDRYAGTDKAGTEKSTLTISKPTDQDSFWWSISQKRDGTTKGASLPVSQDEALAIGTLMQAAIPLILAWE